MERNFHVPLPIYLEFAFQLHQAEGKAVLDSPSRTPANTADDRGSSWFPLRPAHPGMDSSVLVRSTYLLTFW